jgi:hypothetical protein
MQDKWKLCDFSGIGPETVQNLLFKKGDEYFYQFFWFGLGGDRVLRSFRFE